ncbi:hypothetical protein [Gloeobacter morelensis]|uniref:Uncharacterized protein n=1 Tax=Gloeobacter morelensis MG652769 TaxID=2781736 RepID=A0ABY3PSH5_9CYAN|nr:hypothetical protein [Gloeobacter morelensis]UFP96427.1 hypothetical protein ISF26_09535 [Gloeobacter morelensis MG652769]
MKGTLAGIFIIWTFLALPAFAEGSIPIIINDLIKKKIETGSMNLAPESYVELYDGAGNFLESLQFVRKQRAVEDEPRTVSTYLGKKYGAMISDTDAYRSHAFTREFKKAKTQ